MADTGNAYKIRVDSDVLKAKADTVSGLVGDLESQFEELKRVIERTSDYWIGEGGEAKRKKYVNQQTTIEEMINRLRKYPGDLLQMAGIYDEAEDELIQAPQSLSTDVIV